MSITDGKFYNPTIGSIIYDNMVEEITNYIKKMPGEEYDVIVGCDSSSEDKPNFPVAIVILRKGRGGRFFLKKTDYSVLSKEDFNSWKERILEEVFLSCKLAVTLKEDLKAAVERLPFEPNYEFQYIHADIGKNGITKDMIKEVTALIRGNGFTPRIKPHSFAASIIADRFT
ncbi:MAG: ribonuclease H-like YkuK family protein [Patescibacteria group bacterium]